MDSFPGGVQSLLLHPSPSCPSSQGQGLGRPGFGWFPSLWLHLSVSFSLSVSHILSPFSSPPISVSLSPPAHLGVSLIAPLSPSLSVAPCLSGWLSPPAGGLSSSVRPAPLTVFLPAGSPHDTTWTSLPPEGVQHPTPPPPPGAAAGPAARGPGEAAGPGGPWGAAQPNPGP